MNAETLAWLNFWTHLFQVVATVIIAGLVGFVAYRQYRLDKVKFKWELYDRRLKAYMIVKRLTSATVTMGIFPADNAAELESLRNAMWESDFLFGAPIADYLKVFMDKGAELYIYERQSNSDSLNEARRKEANALRDSLFRWFVGQPDNQVKLFAQYLRIK